MTSKFLSYIDGWGVSTVGNNVFQMEPILLYYHIGEVYTIRSENGKNRPF